ncbi:MAG TPA: histidine phosphatase family protein [Usitatibacter sp.]|nr:histidine phosphatase family protein [Usitatibacter sp.]
MELILWRHADAEDAGSQGDAARRLTKKGRKQAERMAEWLKTRTSDEWRIVVSPAKRALETVAPLDRAFDVSEEVGTGASVSSVLHAAGWPHGERPVIVVGHQPTLGEVAAELLGAEAGLAIRKGAAWWFVSRGGETVLKAVMNPELLEEQD